MLPFDRIRTELRHQRNAKDWSLDKLAEVSGVDRATIHQLENVRTYPTIDKTAFETVRKLIEALGLTLTDFFAELEGLPDLFNRQGIKDLPSGVAKADNPATGHGAEVSAADFGFLTGVIARSSQEIVSAIDRLNTSVKSLVDRVDASTGQTPAGHAPAAGSGARAAGGARKGR